MGIESKIFVVNKYDSSLKDGEDKKFAQVIATYEAREFPALRAMFSKPTDCYIFADNGNTEIHEDKYGEPLTEASVEEVVNCLTNLTGEDKTYRRTLPLLAMLEKFRDNEAAWESLAILHYGC